MTGNKSAGILLLNKSPGYTSFDSLNAVKKALGTGKVGHTGTLDKFASGLLVVLAGWALKLSPWFDRCDKRYEGLIRFGVETDTLDPEGEPIAEADPPSREALEQALTQFRGDIMQAPPAYSAIHLDGKRAYQLARSGVEVKMEKRPVTIHALELRSYDPPDACVYVHCSKGAYIRSLARDIAIAAGSRAHLAALERKRVAGFDIAQAVPMDAPDLAAAFRSIGPDTFDALDIPRLTVDENAAKSMRQGKPLDGLLGDAPDAESLGVFCDGAFVAVLVKKQGSGNDRWSYGYVHAGA
ncbi:tRNA pseudouridine(55) synthase TruB [Treponema primitia]|uniref:tRNA pseudouridine(55) synthase TruB n=1 Tax=Treponema primitia TaxID=88058 RepID=UPI00397FCE39